MHKYNKLTTSQLQTKMILILNYFSLLDYYRFILYICQLITLKQIGHE